MRSQISANWGLAAAVLLLTASFGLAQNPGKMPVDRTPDILARADRKPNMLARLGLSREQLEQIRRLNISRKPLMQSALSRVREANRALDESIYADVLNESDLAARIKEVQNAQSDLIALRSANESAIRRVLTPDQLALFREMRSRFEQMKEQRQDRRKIRRQGSPVNGDASRPI